MVVAVVLIVLIVGSVLFHFLSPWYFTPIASNWGTIDDTIGITFWVTGIVFVAVNAFVAYAVIRFRYRKEARAAYEPENKKLEWWLLGLTTVGVAAMLAPGLFVWAKFVDVPQDAAQVEALGQQWQWMYRFPGKDGKLGTVDAQFVSDANPFGMNPGDASGQDDILVAHPELHLPVDKPVKMLLRSKDVLHNFSVAQIRVKMDLVPGLVTHMWFTPTRAGTYDLLCEELCGIAHFAMRGASWWRNSVRSRTGSTASRRSHSRRSAPWPMPPPARRCMPCARPATGRKPKAIPRSTRPSSPDRATGT
jgi:cytochrome c oxidase subunit 2